MTLSGAPGGFGGAAGGITGREHRRAERDGQDGYALVATDGVVAAIVTDGCSSGRSSEIGARVGAAWLGALVAERFGGKGSGIRTEAHAREAAGEVASALLARLELLARSFDPKGDVDAARVDQALLFGFLAAVVTSDVSIVFGIGDGIVVVDDHVTILDPGPANAPPYVAYGLLGPALAPQVHFVGPTSDLRVLAVATDGLLPLAMPSRSTSKRITRATNDDAPSLLTLASDRRYATNPSLLRKRLVVLSDRGLFSDDATLAVLQRSREPTGRAA